jgi:hypothetical protein
LKIEMKMIEGGKQSIYQMFHDWVQYAKLEADYRPEKFFHMHFKDAMSELQLHEFLSNYELWQMCKFNAHDITVLEKIVHYQDDD